MLTHTHTHTHTRRPELYALNFEYTPNCKLKLYLADLSVFQTASGNRVSAPVIFNTTARNRLSFATVVVPTWPFAASTTSVSLSRMSIGGLRLVPHVSLEDVHFEFIEVVSNHENLTNAPICSSGICWPVNITVYGFGFNTSSRSVTFDDGSKDFVEYSCALQSIQDPEAMISSSRVVIRSTDSLACYFGTSQKVQKFVFGTYGLRVKKEGNVLAFVGGGLSAVTLDDKWVSMICGARSGAICQSYSSGGAFIKINGMGFSAGSRYWCTFTSATESVQGEDAYVLSRNQLQCKIPFWPFSAGNVTVSIHRDRSNLTLGITSNRTLDFGGATVAASQITLFTG